jgi:GT2 family glycosyltransferase
MDISIIIVNYKSRDLTLNCIRSIKAADWPGLDYEIIVIDNYSGDLVGDDLKPFGKIRFIMNGQNTGLGAANNKGIRLAEGKYIVIMNPDVQASKTVFFGLYEFMEKNQEVGVAGPKQLYPDGTIQDSCYRWPGFLTPIYRRTPLGKIGLGKKDLDRFLYKDYNKDNEREVDWLLGSFLFCRSSALRQVGLFDESYFLYFEDTDLCKRFWQSGWKVMFNPRVEIIHNHRRQSAKAPWYKFYASVAAWHHIFSWFKYLKKWGL